MGNLPKFRASIALFWATAGLLLPACLKDVEKSSVGIRMQFLGFPTIPLASPTPTPSSSPPSLNTLKALEFMGTNFTRGSGAGSSSNTYYAFFNVPADCLPIYPATIIWRARPEQKSGYYSTFFWANEGNFLWKSGSPDTYWGAHPYPDTGANNFNLHHWEIATDFGGDITTTLAGGPKTVVYQRWYTQGFRAWAEPSGEKVTRYYFDLPSVASSDIVESRVSANFGNINPPSPALVWGGAPWGSAFGNDETYKGMIRGIQIYNRVLSEGELLAESITPLSTQAGRDSIWYLKMNPSLEDMTSDAASGPQGGCTGKRRIPVLRVDGVTVNPGNPQDATRAKVRNGAP